jgi:D-alanyl-lipoteichoic acid acyltransferase DltB (MBOAT superfamily)
MPQFLRLGEKRITRDEVGLGVSLLFIGLCKKTALADPLGSIADHYFDLAGAGVRLDWTTAWVGVLSFGLGIYLDFSAYSDMAIGIARLFGLELPQNFDAPFHSTSIVEFWRRWHMTLSRFLRDYLYVPLGGNRLGPVRRNVNLMITMLLGGLWHGAGWSFCAFGGLHGLYLMVAHRWKGWPMLPALPARCLNWTLTFAAVTVAWVFFRAATLEGALRYLELMFSFRGPGPVAARLETFRYAWLSVSVAALWVLLEPRLMRFRNTWFFAFLVALAAFVGLLCLGEEREFIYFTF